MFENFPFIEFNFSAFRTPPRHMAQLFRETIKEFGFVVAQFVFITRSFIDSLSHTHTHSLTQKCETKPSLPKVFIINSNASCLQYSTITTLIRRTIPTAISSRFTTCFTTSNEITYKYFLLFLVRVNLNSRRLTGFLLLVDDDG